MDTRISHSSILDRRWRLADQVAVRPESFGGLAYHFGNRRLSFLKDWTLVAIVTGLDGSRSGRQACSAAGVKEADQPRYAQALSSLAASELIVPIDDEGDGRVHTPIAQPGSETP